MLSVHESLRSNLNVIEMLTNHVLLLLPVIERVVAGLLRR